MKKYIHYLAIISGIVLWSPVVFSQSLLYSVSPQAAASDGLTLYGQFDTGLGYVNNVNGKSEFLMDSGIMSFETFGMKGSEFIGHATKVIFALEQNFLARTGTAVNSGSAFGSQSFVGLSNAEFGTLTLGAQYDFSSDFISWTNIGNGMIGSYGGDQGDLDRLGGDHIPNAIKYVSPAMHGFMFGAMYGMGSGTSSAENAFSTGVLYQDPVVTASIAYTTVRHPTTSSSLYLYPYSSLGITSLLGQPTVTVNADGTVTDLYSSSAMALDRISTLGTGATYTLGKFTGGLLHTETRLYGYGRESTLHTTTLGFMYAIRTNLTNSSNFYHATLEGHTWNALTTGLDYQFSPRTDVYASLTYLHTSAGVLANASGGCCFSAASGSKQLATRIALRHKF